MLDFFLSLFATTVSACSLDGDLMYQAVGIINIIFAVTVFIVLPICLVYFTILRVWKKYRIKGTRWAFKKVGQLVAVICIFIALVVIGFLIKDHFDIQKEEANGWFRAC